MKSRGSRPIRLRLELGRSGFRSEVVVGEGLLTRLPALVDSLVTRRGFVLADSRLATQRRRVVASLERAGWSIAHEDVPALERTKDIRRAAALYPRLVAHGMDRHSVLFALGGGVIGDLGGFLAGTYLRGIPWVGLPTTLLAQVDSSVGGKTGVNLSDGKNLVGVFHQPALVVADTGVLKSLSTRDRVSGFGEMLKYGLVFSRPDFEWLRRHESAILDADPRVTPAAVARALRHKIAVVKSDEHETRGRRRLLNFGHTLGHALESATAYRRYRHGEAVVWGMRAALALSVVRGHLRPVLHDELERYLRTLPMPSLPRGVTAATLLPFVKRDKKARDGKVAFVLLRDVGRPLVDDGVSDDEIAAAVGFLGVAP